MNQLARRIVIRLIAMPIIAVIVALTGGITASLLGVAGMAFAGAFVYTMVDERFFRRVLFGKVGGTNPLVWWAVHEIYETVFAVLFTWGVFALFNWHVGTTWVAVVGAVVSWAWLTSETLGNIFPLIALRLAMRR